MKRSQKIIRIVLLGLLFVLCAGPFSQSAYALNNGTEKTFYPTGQIRLKVTYKKGRIVRKSTYYKNGRFISDYKYKDGKPYLKRYFYENGRLKSIWTRKSGFERFYYPDGRLKAVVPKG